ncbi:transaldolase family protein [Labilibacter marinus]|uniref:transaldolase family protein n=1 Tax=Labilibacter marinus TaxID=1477105 RepID=UPI0013013CBB|nr:transaldolase family protein [Labilibacter marinus]
MISDYFYRVGALTPTKFWINNVTKEEAKMAIEAGALGCTQNPSYTWKMLTHPEYGDYAKKVLAETLKESDDDNEVACIFQRKLIAEIAEIFMPVYEKTNGKHGYVSIQGDPIHEHDAQVIIDEARRNREISPNMMIKIPATKAGIEAMDVLIAENTPLNATEVMGMSQALQLCDMYKSITERTKTRPVMLLSLITGIYDEWLQKDVQEKGIEVNPDALYQAGMVIAKKVYKTMHDRGTELGFIGGGMRGLHHFTEMVGGDVNITMNWKGHAEELLKLNKPVVSRLFNPTQDVVLEELLAKLPEFNKAYFENGLTVDEYEEYGPVKYFWESFVSAWKNVVKTIGEMR